jgi:hypothetical protein
LLIEVKYINLEEMGLMEWKFAGWKIGPIQREQIFPLVNFALLIILSILVIAKCHAG